MANTTSRPVTVDYADGSSDDHYDSYDAAIAAIEARYPDAVTSHDGDLSEGGDRTLVWSDEESSIDDDGQCAIASIRWADRMDD